MGANRNTKRNDSGEWTRALRSHAPIIKAITNVEREKYAERRKPVGFAATAHATTTLGQQTTLFQGTPTACSYLPTSHAIVGGVTASSVTSKR